MGGQPPCPGADRGLVHRPVLRRARGREDRDRVQYPLAAIRHLRNPRALCIHTRHPELERGHKLPRQPGSQEGPARRWRGRHHRRLERRRHRHCRGRLPRRRKPPFPLPPACPALPCQRQTHPEPRRQDHGRAGRAARAGPKKGLAPPRSPDPEVHRLHNPHRLRLYRNRLPVQGGHSGQLRQGRNSRVPGRIPRRLEPVPPFWSRPLPKAGFCAVSG